jgi:hypothetical protein
MLRCAAWVIAEVSVAAAALLNEMEKSQSTTTKVGWAIFGFTLLGKAAMTIRCFLDQSYAQHTEKLEKSNGSDPAPVAAPGPAPVV